MLVWRFSLAESADGADNRINPINLSEAINLFCERAAGRLGVQPRRG